MEGGEGGAWTFIRWGLDISGCFIGILGQADNTTQHSTAQDTRASYYPTFASLTSMLWEQLTLIQQNCIKTLGGVFRCWPDHVVIRSTYQYGLYILNVICNNWG